MASMSNAARGVPRSPPATRMIQSPAILTSLIAALAGGQLREPVQTSSETTAVSRRAAAGARVDSIRVVRTARRAQEQFESLRRANLPFGSGAPRGPCDLQIGRFCYWHDDGAPRAEIPEPEPVTRARERLLTTLGEAARLVKGDEWIFGQRVRYLLEASRTAEAIAAANDCWTTRWWCDALAGLALHVAGDFARADSAFTRALSGMSPEQRCRWTDISLFVDGTAAKRYRRLPCADRAVLERRFWWLSQPLYSLPGNDLRTEFFARRTISRLEQQARSAYNLSWGSDVDELLLRFGWPTWWTRDQPSSGLGAAPPSIVGHEPTPSFYFHPADRLLETRPADARADDWDLTRRLPAARYAPAYAASFSDLRTQVSVFRRGDSAIVIATYEPPRDSLFDDGISEVALALGSDETTPMTVVRQRVEHGHAEPFVARTAWAPMLVSIELTAARRRGVARARFGILPDDARRAGAAGRLTLSDILMYRAVDSMAGSLEEVARYALGAARIPVGGRVGVYWELYGARPGGEPLSVDLTVERVRVGWRTRAAEALRLASKATPLRVRWHEVPKRDSGIASRAIIIDVSALPAGRYRMQLMVTADDGSTAVSERSVELVAPR
jgi:hypothetical protein